MATKNLLAASFGVQVDYTVPEEELDEMRAAFASVSPYFILFTARTGSTFLTHELQRTEVLSIPHEWFNWDYVEERRAIENFSVSQYLRELVESKKSKNGVFGAEVNWPQLCSINSIVPVQRLFQGKIRWFFLRRRNLVAQAISNYIADQSRIFHSYQLNSDAEKKISSVRYNGESLRGYVNGFVYQETSCVNWMNRSNITPVNIFYEDIVADPKSSSRLIANVMGVWLPKNYIESEINNPIKRMSGELNANFEEQFRQEQVSFLKQALHDRPIVLAPASTI